jgi:hypothetical protein
MLGATVRGLMVTMGLFAAGCAVAPAPADKESEGQEESAMLIPIPRRQTVTFQVDASIQRVATAQGSWGQKQLQYLGFHIKNTGTIDAAPSQLVVSCSLASPAINFGPECLTPLVIGLPAIPAGGFYDYSYPARGLVIGAGNDSTLWTPSGMSLDETVTLTFQSSTQWVASNAVSLHDQCAGQAACGNIPVTPNPYPSTVGLQAMPSGIGYHYALISPTQIDFRPTGPDQQPIGTTPVHGGEAITVNLALYAPTSYGGGVEPVNIYVDGAFAATATSPGTSFAPTVAVLAPPADGLTHTLRATFAGAAGFAPTVSRMVTFTTVP